MIYNWDRLPVSDVSVSVMHDGKPLVTALSDIRGRFTLPEIPYGKITLQFTKDTYETVVWDLDFSSPSQVVYMKLENVDELLGQSADAIEQQNWADATAFLERTDKLSPHSHLTLYLRGVMLTKQGKPAEAAALLETLSGGSSVSFAVELSLADLYQYKLNDAQKALLHLKRALTVRKDLDVEKRVADLSGPQA
jgi:hypothetical protein